MGGKEAFVGGFRSKTLAPLTKLGNGGTGKERERWRQNPAG